MKTLILAAVVLAACGGKSEPARQLTHDKPIIPALFYVDSAGNPIGAATPDSATIEKVAGSEKVPVVAPDAHAVTWGEFRSANGVATVTCQDGATKIHIDYAHLIPSGVYTGWLVFFAAPGFPTAKFDALTGLAPIGPADGSQSKLVADASGAGSLDATVPAGNVTVSIPNKAQQVPSCLLDAYEVHLVAAYHLDGKTCGATPCAPDKIAEQVGFMIAHGEKQTM